MQKREESRIVQKDEKKEWEAPEKKRGRDESYLIASINFHSLTTSLRSSPSPHHFTPHHHPHYGIQGDRPPG